MHLREVHRNCLLCLPLNLFLKGINSMHALNKIENMILYSLVILYIIFKFTSKK